MFAAYSRADKHTVWTSNTFALVFLLLERLKKVPHFKHFKCITVTTAAVAVWGEG